MSLSLRPEVQALVRTHAPSSNGLLMASSLALAAVDMLGFIAPNPRLS
jgi:hypothetical protein